MQQEYLFIQLIVRVIEVFVNIFSIAGTDVKQPVSLKKYPWVLSSVKYKDSTGEAQTGARLRSGHCMCAGAFPFLSLHGKERETEWVYVLFLPGFTH